MGAKLTSLPVALFQFYSMEGGVIQDLDEPQGTIYPPYHQHVGGSTGPTLQKTLVEGPGEGCHQLGLDVQVTTPT